MSARGSAGAAGARVSRSWGRRRPAAPRASTLREAGSQAKNHVMENLPEYLAEFEKNFTAAGGVIHWARDADEANAIVTELVEANAPVLESGRREVIKVKSMATQEIGLNEHLETQDIDAFETDLAELIVQLGDDKPSHILVPAIHRNRDEIRDIFMDKMPDAGDLTNEPAVLAELPGDICATSSSPRRSRFPERTSASPTPGHSASSSRRATAACA